MLSSFSWSDYLYHACKENDDVRISTSERGLIRGRSRKNCLRKSAHYDQPRFEKVIGKLKDAQIEPVYTRNMLLSSEDDQLHSEWFIDVAGVDPAEGHLDTRRARRKRQQVSNLLMACRIILKSLIQQKGVNNIQVVEFCAGSGHVSLPLAYLFPQTQFMIIDANPISSLLATERIQKAKLPQENIICITGKIQEFDKLAGKKMKQPFDLGIGLHACGELSDIILDLCLKHQAAFVLAPCCVGKIQHSSSVSLCYPRSRRFQDCLYHTNSSAAEVRKDYEALASAADVDRHSISSEDAVNRKRRLCKSFIEIDRLWRAREHRYITHLMLMHPQECTPKNDVLMAWPQQWGALLTEKQEIPVSWEEVLFQQHTDEESDILPN